MTTSIHYVACVAYAQYDGSVSATTDGPGAVMLQWYDGDYHIIDDPEDLPDWFWSHFQIDPDSGAVAKRAPLPTAE